MSFALPPDISYHQLQTKNGMVYTFRHQSLGELGRIIIEGTPDGQCRITADVVGDSADPMTAKREEIFRPLSEQLTSALDAAMGDLGNGMAVPPTSAAIGQPEAIPHTIVPCPRSGKGVAMLVFADHAKTEADMEDYARKMFPRYKELNLPTWIIGPPMGVSTDDTPAMTLKVWPKRKPLEHLSPNQVNALLDQLIAKQDR